MGMIILLLLIWVHEEICIVLYCRFWVCIRIIIRFEVVVGQELNMKIKSDLELEADPKLDL